MYAYCMKCRTTREIKNPVLVSTKSLRKRVRGYCSVCNSKMSSLVPMDQMAPAYSAK
jgi:hypothetical protein